MSGIAVIKLSLRAASCRFAARKNFGTPRLGVGIGKGIVQGTVPALVRSTSYEEGNVLREWIADRRPLLLLFFSPPVPVPSFHRREDIRVDNVNRCSDGSKSIRDLAAGTRRAYKTTSFTFGFDLHSSESFSAIDIVWTYISRILPHRARAPRLALVYPLLFFFLPLPTSFWGLGVFSQSGSAVLFQL